nr:MAG TPA: putative glycosyl transferase [Caudoviricetes sp.]
MDYLLSIIIPEYNQNYVYLKQCLDSIFARQQDVDFRRIQVILVKDSLEDDISDFYRYPIEVLQTAGHTGCGIARQIGLNAAKGE